jgi:hypothetical protein
MFGVLRRLIMSKDKPPESDSLLEKSQLKSGDNVQQNALTERSQNNQFETASKAGQDFTSMTELKVPSDSEIKQHEQSNFAILGDDGSELASSKIKLAQAGEGEDKARLRFHIGGDLSELSDANLVKVDSSKVIDGAQKAIADKSRWKGPMCNVFVDDVMRKAGVPLPWKVTENHSCQEMVKKLSLDPKFDLVWRLDKSNPKASGETWKSFGVQDGDIAIWSNEHLVHTGLLEEAINNRKNIFYAGSSNETGANYADMDYFVNSKVKGYGPPDYVFRYRGFKK